MSSGGLGAPAHANGNTVETPAVMRQDADRGAAVHTFDPDAPPQEKGAQVIKGRDYLDSVKPQEPQHRGGCLVLVDLIQPSDIVSV